MPTQSQSEALERLRANAEVLSVEWNDVTGTPQFIHGRFSVGAQREPSEVVHQFLDSYGEVYGVAGRDNYEVISTKQDTLGNYHIRVGRLHESMRVYPSLLTFWITPSRSIERVKAYWPLLTETPSQKAKLDLEKAIEIASRACPKSKSLGLANQPRLEYHLTEERKRFRLNLAWNFIMRFTGQGPATEGFVIDAINGRILRRYPDEDEVATTTTGIGINNADETAGTPVRNINADNPGGGGKLTLLDTTRSVVIETRDMAGANTTSATAYPLCADDDGDGTFSNTTNSPRGASNRPEVDAHLNTGTVHDYFARSVIQNGISLFGRAGWLNDPSQKWVSAVHLGMNDKSSSFSRTARVTSHGDGDGANLTYKPTLDTCAHEWTHGVQFAEVAGGVSSGGFDGNPGENFVLKEATADMFACSINRDWGWRFAAVFEDDVALPGATHTSTGKRLRGMRTPSTYGQPDHYFAGGDTLGLGFAGTTEDYTRCGILDKAAYLMAAGGTHPSAASNPTTYPPIAVYGIGCTAFENILYYALVNLSGPADVFSDFRQDMIDAANALYPADPCKANTVRRAFDAVGIYAGGATTPPPAPSGPDPMITPWGAVTDVPPYWQTPDIFVRDAVGNPAAPLKGQVNRLFARVRNIGDADANPINLTFSFVPYGAGAGPNTPKIIGTVSANVPAGGAPVEVEIAWDLTDLTDTNGGAWPLPLGSFDHFCVKVHLDFASDVDACNNDAQNNFANVGDADGDGITRLLVGNSSKEARWIALIPDHRVARSWRTKLDLASLCEGSAKALIELARSKRIEFPWVPDGHTAYLIPLRGGETRPIELSWHAEPAEDYEGGVYGYLRGRSNGHKAVAGSFVAEMDHLRLRAGEFKTKITGRITSSRETLSLRGTMNGRVDRKSGEFEGGFEGIVGSRGHEKKGTFKAVGQMAAAASFSFVVINLETEQGLDCAITLVGELRSLCESVRQENFQRQSASKGATGRKMQRAKRAQ